MQLTIYILNHNYGHFLKECLDSVVRQPRVNEVEWIYVDDGSQDQSDQILEPYRDLFSKILVNKTPQGLIKSANKAIREASGNFVMRLDADDFLAENALNTYLNTLKEEVDVVFPDYFLYQSESQQSYHFKRNSNSAELSSDFPFHGACTGIKKSFLDVLGFYDESFTRQDGYYIWLQSLIHQKKLFHIKEPLFFYRIHGNNLTHSFRKLLLNRIQIKKKLLLPRLSRPFQIVIPLQEDLLQKRLQLVQNLMGYLQDFPIQVQWILLTEVTINNPVFVKNNIQQTIRDKSKSYTNALVKLMQQTPESPFAVVEPDYPHLMPESLLELLLTSVIQPYDRILSLYLEPNSLYKYESSGFQPLHAEKSLRMERNNIYRKAGGLSFYKNVQAYQYPENKRTGFVEMDHLSTLRFSEWNEIETSLNPDDD